jgi:hypothetical protein
MRLSDLHGCDNCGGQIAPIFYVVRMSPAVINMQEARRGIAQTEAFGFPLALIEGMGMSGEIGTIAMDEREDSGKHIMTEIWLCQGCHMKLINLAELSEKVSEREHAKEKPE